MLKKGDKAPSFNLSKIDGTMLSSDSYAGKWYLLYFYPKDSTPGCTKQALEFADVYADFQALGVDIIGINADSVESHQTFCTKNNLPFILLSDSDKELLKAYKVWGEKKFMDKIYEGLIRSTFLINPEGNLEEVLYNVKATGHGARALKIVQKAISNYH